MFMGIFRSKLSPIYWLIRFFGKDLAKTSDIDADRFRMMILPGPGYDMKQLCKEGKAIFVNILGVDNNTMLECFKGYHDLAIQVAAEGYMPFSLREYKINNFTFEVTEEEHDKITSYLSGKKVFIIASDELSRLRQLAEEEARHEIANRTFRKFIDESIEELEKVEVEEFESFNVQAG